MKSYQSISIVVSIIFGLSSYAFSQDNRNYSFNGTLTENISTSKDSLNVKMAGTRLIIENLPNDDVLEIYNIMGTKVFNRRVNAGTNEYLLSLPRGYYIVKIGKFTRKIVIR